MSDSKTGNDNTVGAPSRTLSLKRGLGQGTVRQNLSHGRSNSVVVETKKRRIKRPGDTEQVFAPKSESLITPKVEPVEEAPKVAKPQPAPSIVKKLSASELDARSRA